MQTVFGAVPVSESPGGVMTAVAYMSGPSKDGADRATALAEANWYIRAAPAALCVRPDRKSSEPRTQSA